MPALDSSEKRYSAKLASKLASVLSSDVALLAKESLDPTKINMIVTNAFNILQGMGLADVAVSEALSGAGIAQAAKGNEMHSQVHQLRRYLAAHPDRKKDVIAALLKHGRRQLATAASRMVIAKKPHFNLSSYAEKYEDAVSTLAANNYGPWKNTAEAEKHVKKAIRDHAKAQYDDVMESFGKDDIKYIVEMHLYQDDADPYGLDPPDPKVGKAIQKVLEKTLGKDWKKVSGYNTAEKHGMMREAGDDPKAWVVWIEGHGVHTVDSMWEPILNGVKKAGFKDASAEPYDNATIIVHPEAD